MIRLPRSPVLSVVALLAFGLPAEAAVIYDNWYTSVILDKRVGYLHETAETDVEGGRRVIKTIMDTRFTIRRMGTELSIASQATYVETFEGEPLRFESRNRLAANDYSIRAERQGDQFLVTQESMGQKTTTEVPYSPDVLFPRALEREIAARALKAGTRLELKTFSPDTARPTRVVIEGKGLEEVELSPGVRERLFRVDSTQDVMTAVTLSEWRDTKGTVRKSSLPILGVQIVSLLTTREKALLGPESVELLVSTLVDPEVALPRPRGITRAVYRLRLKEAEGGAALSLPEDDRQRIVGRGHDGVVLEIRTERWAQGDKSLPKPEHRYLRPSSVLQTENPKVKELAQLAAGPGAPEQVAKSINRWVHGAIKKKSLSVGLATAAEVATDLTGDCTEHAVLAAALARARGIPSKVAMGLVYLEGKFGYHMWTEVWDQGWRAIDPAFGQDAADATHIKLAESALDSGFVDEAVISLVQIIANLDVRIVEYDLDGRTHETARAGEAGTFHGGQYENVVYGLKLDPPKGWRIKPGRAAGQTGPLARLEGPGGATGELEATAISYEFRLAEWVVKSQPSMKVVHQKSIAIGKKSGVRYVLEGGGRREGLVAFLDRDTLFTLRVRPLGPRDDKLLDSIQGSIGIQ